MNTQFNPFMPPFPHHPFIYPIYPPFYPPIYPLYPYPMYPGSYWRNRRF